MKSPEEIKYAHLLKTMSAKIDKIGPDKTLQKLPHFQRAKLLGKDYVKASLWYFYQGVEIICDKLSPQVPSNHLIINFLSYEPKFRAVLDEFLKFDPSSANFGNLDIHFFLYKFQRYQGVVFQATDALCQMLTHTDLAGDVPVSFFRAPYNIMYIEFGQERNLDYQLYNQLSGFHTIEGAYVITYESPHFEGDPEEARILKLDPDKPTRKMEIMFVGSPLGKENIMDDCTRNITFNIQDDEQPLDEMLDNHFSYFSKQVELSNTIYEGTKNMTTMDQEEFEKGVRLLSKFFLYLNTSNALLTQKNPHADLKARIARVKQKKRAKLSNKLSKTYDRVVVGPLKSHGAFLETVNAGKGKAVHWRRGHYHRYRVGPGRREVRLKWLPPTLINADKLHGDDNSLVKDYKIK